ncbi:Holliday junction resolvase RuvX [Oceanicoccus sagamiensis]|uniref:Putative pre-16S rRNA nuclease n=1 Tax=Oceanicoccus sagamiensis TaxID=716816 RepID=A0A1X9N960_9GAMM|nr:Holliday junction resolvase RuvX [Oceanicoccus sagamiensis]ARN73721.1 Holliday junction resolvase RuvX [Oceanicoccus sagamiensis]
MTATPQAAKTILCFDYGTKSIGVAVGQSITQTANPLADLKAKDGIPDWDELKKLIDEWQPNLLLVGLPLNMDGSPSEIGVRAKKFANRLHGRFGLPFEMADERLSSFEAKGEIIQQTGSRDFKKNNVDSLAAKVILESWFVK